jgi:hypothetical protein
MCVGGVDAVSIALRLSLIDGGDPSVSYSTGWATIADSHAVVAEARTAGAKATAQ